MILFDDRDSLSVSERSLNSGLLHDHPLHLMLDCLTYVKTNDFRAFVAQDGSLWSFWRLHPLSDDVLMEAHRAIASKSFMDMLNRFPALSSGQILRFKHKNIAGLVNDYISYEPKYPPTTPYSENIVSAVANRQMDGAEFGFFDDLEKIGLSKLKEDVQREMDDPQFVDSNEEALERSMANGRYAQVTELVLGFRFDPYLAARDRSKVAKTMDLLKSSLGIGDVSEEFMSVYQDVIKRYKKAIKEIETALSISHLSPVRMAGQTMLDILFRELNPGRYFELDAPTYRPDLTLREQVVRSIGEANPRLIKGKASDIGKVAALSPIINHDKGYEIDGIHHRVITLESLPRSINMSPGMLWDKLKEIDEPGYFCINFVIRKTKHAWFKATMKANFIQFQEAIQDAIPLISADASAYQEKREAIDYVLSVDNPESAFQQAPLSASFQLVIRGTNEEELNELAYRLQTHFWSNGYWREQRASAHARNTLPMNYTPQSNELLRSQMDMLSLDLAYMAPIYDGFSGVTDSPLVMVNNQYGAPIFIDPWDESVSPAAHALVLGGTGSGKSFWVNLFVQQVVAKEQVKVFGFDKGKSFETTINTMGGEYIDLAKANTRDQQNVCINPFYLANDDDGYPVTPEDNQFMFMHGVLLSMAKTGEKDGVIIDLDKPVYSLYLTTLIELFQKRTKELSALLDQHRSEYPDASTRPDFDYGSYEYSEITFTKYYEFLEKKPNSKRACELIVDYHRTLGAFGSLIDGPLSVNWDNDIICFETDGISDMPNFNTVMMVLFYQVGEYCKTRLPRDMKKILFMDEAWAPLADPVIQQKVSGYYYELRKYQAMVMLITQSMQQIVTLTENADKGQSGILGQVKHFFLLSCSPADHKLAKDKLNFEDEELAAWGSLASLPPYYSEVFYRCMNNQDRAVSGKFRATSNGSQIWLSSTSPKDITLRDDTVKELMSQGMDLNDARQAANAALSEQYPYGSKYMISKEDST